jgi:hypothetical protein
VSGLMNFVTGGTGRHSGVNCASYGQFAGAANKSGFNNRIRFRDRMTLFATSDQPNLHVREHGGDATATDSELQK